MIEDFELLREYAEHRSQPAFTELVGRYVNLVYSAALRLVGEPHQAEDVAQTVFLQLARKSGSLRPGTILSGWLYRATRYAANDMRRAEMRRRRSTLRPGWR
jgi:RNA polymerase sigma factor (sigma-70 family)